MTDMSSLSWDLDQPFLLCVSLCYKAAPITSPPLLPLLANGKWFNLSSSRAPEQSWNMEEMHPGGCALHMVNDRRRRHCTRCQRNFLQVKKHPLPIESLHRRRPRRPSSVKKVVRQQRRTRSEVSCSPALISRCRRPWPPHTI